MSRRPPLSGERMRVVEEPIPDENPVEGDPANPGGGGGYWAFVASWFWLLVKLAALLGLIAGSFGLWLAAATVWHWMGL